MTQKTQATSMPATVESQISATIYGQCVGDALGLLTEFMDKREAAVYYGKKPKDLNFDQKVPDFHRNRWEVGDWTDDSDQTILILQSLLFNKGEINVSDFADRMKFWMRNGFPELGDHGGLGIGRTTLSVLGNQQFVSEPHKVSKEFWEKTGCNMAANGAVMRTSIVGLHCWRDLDTVKENALAFGKCTHHDPRCQASVVAVSTCIALMLQHIDSNIGVATPKPVDVSNIIRQSYEIACQVLETKEQKDELWKFMSCKKLKELALADRESIGYTYKCMGSGFWALKKDDFKKAMIKLVMEGGDADTNASVAGAMLACKLGQDAIPDVWSSGLKHKGMLDQLIARFTKLQTEMSLPLVDRSDDNQELDMTAIRDRAKQIQLEEEKQIIEARKKRQEEKGLPNI